MEKFKPGDIVKIKFSRGLYNVMILSMYSDIHGKVYNFYNGKIQLRTMKLSDIVIKIQICELFKG